MQRRPRDSDTHLSRDPSDSRSLVVPGKSALVHFSGSATTPFSHRRGYVAPHGWRLCRAARSLVNPRSSVRSMRSLRGIGNRNNIFKEDCFESSPSVWGGGDVQLCFAPPVKAGSAGVKAVDGTSNPAYPLWRGLRTIQDPAEDIPS